MINIEWNKVTWYSKLLAVIVLAGAVWLGLYFKNEFKKVGEIKSDLSDTNTVDTLGWETYKNEKYGFELRHPINSKVQVNEDSDMAFDFRISSLPKVNQKTISTSLSFRILNKWQSCDSSSDLISKIGDISYGVYDTFTYGVLAGDSTPHYSRNFTAEVQGKCIVAGIDGWWTDANQDSLPKYDGNVKSFDPNFDPDIETKVGIEILKSFRFINTPSADISNWKTYRNDEFGFGLKYPGKYESGLTTYSTKMSGKFGSATLFQIYDPINHAYEFGPSIVAYVIKQPYGVNGKIYSNINDFVANFLSTKKTLNKKSLVIDGYDAVQLDIQYSKEEMIDSPIARPTRAIFVMKSGVVLSVSYNPLDYPEFDKIFQSLFLFKASGSLKVPNTTFQNKNYGFTLSHPQDFIVSESNDAGHFDELNLYHVAITAPQAYQANTDFSGAFIDVSVSSKTENCIKQNPQGPTFIGTKMIGGTTFYFDPKQPLSDAAMGGQRGFDSLFATVHDGQCYRIQKVMSYRDLHGFVDEPYNYPKHFDEKKVNEDLDAIMNSLIFSK